MGFYRRYVFPWLCDFALDRPDVAVRRRALLENARGEVLEIGLGTGLNLPCYPKEVRRLVAVDPNLGTDRRARRRQALSGIEVERHAVSGEALPFSDGRFDCVVSTFTLCSIPAVAQALTEIRRVLKPGGQFLFLEHGLSPDPRVQKWQRRLNGLEQYLADGCHLDRDIAGLVRGHFAAVAVETSYLPHTPPTHGFLYQGVACPGRQTS